MNALRVENLTKVYKKKSVLDSISFSAESNKTTVILIICSNNDVSYMPEELGLSEHLTVFENLHVMALTRHFKTKGVKELTIEYLKKYGLYDRFDDKLLTLSTSIKKLLSFVITLISDSKVIILDEPFKDIDLPTKRKMMDYIKELKNIKTFIITTEMPDVVKELSDKTFILENGKIIEVEENSDLENRLINGGETHV